MATLMQSFGGNAHQLQSPGISHALRHQGVFIQETQEH
jgi:hypothetical protein